MITEAMVRYSWHTRGVDYVRTNENGHPTKFSVMMRPLKAITALTKAIGAKCKTVEGRTMDILGFIALTVTGFTASIIVIRLVKSCLLYRLPTSTPYYNRK
jgi:hypothetical protein